MKKLLFGIAVAAAAVYVIKKVCNEDKFEEFGENFRKCSSKAKKKSKDLLDKGVNQAEYLGERAEPEFERRKKKLEEMSDR